MIHSKQVKKAHIELSSYCNAACPNCPRNEFGGYQSPSLVPSTMSFEEFCSIVTPEWIKDKHDILFCGNYGDPIMAPHLVDIIKYIKTNNKDIRIKINTNGGMQTVNWWSQFGRLSKQYGNITVTFSVDGLEDTNHIYRRNVSWNKLYSNMLAYLVSGGTANWEFLVFKHNQHQIEEARSLAKKLGFAEFSVKRPIGFDNPYGQGENVMPVLDREGNWSYAIHESDEYKMGRFIKAGYDVELNFPPELALKDLEEKENSVYDAGLEYGYLDEVDISCYTVSHDEIYIASNGEVYPCCWLGMASQRTLRSMDAISFRKMIQDKQFSINALDSSIDEVVDSEFFKYIEKSWSKTHAQGRVATCSMMCNKKHSCNVTEQLYSDTEKL